MRITIATSKRDFTLAAKAVQEQSGNRSRCCVIARAINRHLKPSYEASVGTHKFAVYEASSAVSGMPYRDLPAKVQKSIEAFDALNSTYVPVRFSIDIPVKFLKKRKAA